VRALLEGLGACPEAIEWAGDRTPEQAWRECPRGDWLLWAAERVGVDRRLLVLAACDCAETALVHVPDGEERPRMAIETARAWARGEATIEEVRAAAGAAAGATWGVGGAARAAAGAAWGVGDAARAAAWAAWAAAGAAWAAAAWARGADLVRARVPWAVVDAALAAVEAALARATLAEEKST
jgi:hypothetical protein